MSQSVPPAERAASRRDKLKRLLRQHNVPAMLVTDATNVRYLTGFSGDSTWLVIGSEIERVISDGRFTTQLAEECPEISAEIRPIHKTLPQAAGELIGKSRLSRCGFEAAALSYDVVEQLKEQVASTELVPHKGLVESLRAVKDASEIQEIRLAIRQAEKGFDLLRATLTPEMTELEVAHTLEAGMRRFGAVGASFGIIAAVGPRAALPHARPGASRCSESPFMLVDWGARTNSGYISDLTRMLITGSITPKLQRLYEVVKTAQEQAIARLAPGVKACEVDLAARQVMEQERVASKFTHSLGHGIGLDVHESIRLSPSSTDVLKPGMVVTIEPGLYEPGWGGIRIEDDVLITRDGHEILSSWPRDLESCLVDR